MDPCVDPCVDHLFRIFITMTSLVVECPTQDYPVLRALCKLLPSLVQTRVESNIRINPSVRGVQAQIPGTKRFIHGQYAVAVYLADALGVHPESASSSDIYSWLAWASKCKQDIPSSSLFPCSPYAN